MSVDCLKKISPVAQSSQNCCDDDDDDRPLSLRISLIDKIGLRGGQKASWTFEI